MMKVGELAKAAGVTAETVRHYTREGLLHPRRDPENGYQLYAGQSLDRLRFIQRARTLGFSVREISEILDHADHGDSPCPLVRDLLASRLPEIQARIAQLQALAERMEQALSTWRHMPDGIPDGHSLCRLIESLPEGERTMTEASARPARHKRFINLGRHTHELADQSWQPGADRSHRLVVLGGQALG